MMIRPAPLATMRGNTCCVTASVPNTLTSKRCRTRSSGTSAIGPVWPAPALLMSTSTSQSAALATSFEVMSSFSTVSCGASAAKRRRLGLGLGGGDDPVTSCRQRQAGALPESGSCSR